MYDMLEQKFPRHSFLYPDSPKDFEYRQRAQTLYIARRYLTPDRTDTTRPSLRITVLCGDGRMFSAFRQALIMHHYISPPVPRFSSNPTPGHNDMKNANFFLCEAIGTDTIKMSETQTLSSARFIADQYKAVTDNSVSLSHRVYRDWLRNPEGPCLLSYFERNRDVLLKKIIEDMMVFNTYAKRILASEWSPYIAGKRKTRFISRRLDQ
jgi:hypothetical protein